MQCRDCQGAELRTINGVRLIKCPLGLYVWAERPACDYAERFKEVE
jgi:hypothetical protein